MKLYVFFCQRNKVYILQVKGLDDEIVRLFNAYENSIQHENVFCFFVKMLENALYFVQSVCNSKTQCTITNKITENRLPFRKW